MSSTNRQALTTALARLKDGDRTAARPAFDLAWPVVRSFAVGALGSHADAEDVAQQVLVKVFEQVMHFDEHKDALAWVLEIAAWECRTVRKRAQRSRTTPMGDGALAVRDAAEGPEALAADREMSAALAAALEHLSPVDREAMVGEIARGVAPATWRKRRERAVNRLKIWWRTNHGT